MAKTTDLARQMAATPLSTLGAAAAVAPITEDVAHIDTPDPLILEGFNAPVFFPKTGNLFKDPQTGVVTSPLCNVNMALTANPGIVLRCRVMRKMTPVNENGQLVGYDAETYLQLPSIARGAIAGLEAATPEAESRIKAWRYFVAQAGEKWFENQNVGGTVNAASFDSGPRLVKRIAVSK